jgi:hypothetical protein
MTKQGRHSAEALEEALGSLEALSAELWHGISPLGNALLYDPDYPSSNIPDEDIRLELARGAIDLARRILQGDANRTVMLAEVWAFLADATRATSTEPYEPLSDEEAAEVLNSPRPGRIKVRTRRPAPRQ